MNDHERRLLQLELGVLMTPVIGPSISSFLITKDGKYLGFVFSESSMTRDRGWNTITRGGEDLHHWTIEKALGALLEK